MVAFTAFSLVASMASVVLAAPFEDPSGIVGVIDSRALPDTPKCEVSKEGAKACQKHVCIRSSRNTFEVFC